MSDYSKTTNFTAKDALSSGDPAKLIKGSLFDTEFDAIAVANATKFDTGDIATQAQGEAGTDNTVLMTPLRTEQWSAVWAAENAGIIADLQALADPNADRLLGWDDSASSAIAFAIGNGLTFSDTTLVVQSATVTIDGIAELATNTEVNTGTDALRIVTPAGLAQATSLLQATATQRGAAEIATQAEVDTGTDTARYVTPETLAGKLIGAETARVLKTADETINSDVTFSADAALTGLTMATGSAVYELTGVLRVTSDITPDFKMKFVFSETPTEVGIHAINISTSAGLNVDAQSTATSSMSFTHGGATVNVYQIRGVFKTNATPGTVELQWAQVVSDAAATTVHASSFLRITKLT